MRLQLWLLEPYILQSKFPTSFVVLYRRKLQEHLWQVQSENAALKDTVSRIRSHAASSSNLALPNSIRCADGKDCCPPLQTVPDYSCGAHAEAIPEQSGFSVDCSASADSRVLFHWSGMDFSQVTCQRDKAVHDMTAMSFELEQARCELRCVHAQLRSVVDMEDDMTKVSFRTNCLKDGSGLP